MKVLLISANISCTPYAVYPLGLSIIAQAVKKAGHMVYQFDFLQSRQSLDILSKKIEEINPEVVGISIRNIDNLNILKSQHYINVVKKIIECIRANIKNKCPIVLGGSGFSIMPETILTMVHADYGIVGEGEVLFVDFIEKINRGILPGKTILYSQSKLKESQILPALYDHSLMRFYLKFGNIAQVQTKRGCQYKCIYCSYPFLEGNKIRCREKESIVDDIEFLINEYGIGNLFFIDSVFNDDEGYYITVVQELLRRKINIPWTAFFKPDGLNDDVIKMMKMTGLAAVELGSDASTDTTLKEIGKPFSFSDVVKANNLFNKHGIAVANYFMFGCPGETETTIEVGIKNILHLQRTVSFIFMCIRILPHTGLAQLAIDQGLIKKGQNLLVPVYYINPGIDKDRLETKLKHAFKGVRHCVFPPDTLDKSLAFLHKRGYTGPLWNMLIPGQSRQEKRKRVI